MAGYRSWLPALVGLVLAGAAVPLRPLVFQPRPPGAFVAVLSPSEVAAGERFSVFAGAEVGSGARVLVRVCADRGPCVLERFEPFPPGVTFKWLAAATLRPGSYRLQAFLQVPTPLGYRSVDRFESDVVAH